MASDAPPHSSLLFAGKQPSASLLLNINTSSLDLPHDEDDEIEVDDDEIDDYDVDDAPPSNTNHQVTVAVPMHVQPINTVSSIPRKPLGPQSGPPYPIDESRKLFQRLWTDEDEIELLQGFLEYNSQRGSGGQHHHDTSVFYDQIKSKLQLDFNKNQLVEKLRRLKKKYRNVMQKIGAGKEYVLKSPHDQATFEISKKIWGGVVGNSGNLAGFGTPVKISQSPDDGGVNDEDDDPSPNTNLSFGSGLIAFSPINATGVDEKIPIRARKRSRVSVGGGGGVGNVAAAAAAPQFNQPQTPMSVGVGDQTAPMVATPNVIEDTIRSCLSPIFKELLNGVMSLSNGARGVGGLGELATMPFGSGFGAIGCGGVDLAAGDEKWRNQQILELEVFSKRLELVQDRIKVQLEELRGKSS